MNKRQKKKRIQTQNRKLCERYPFLIPRNVFTDKIIKGFNYTWTEYDAIPDGWRKTFGKLLLEELREALIEANYLDEFRIMQLKEKFGQLRIYPNAAPQKVWDVLHKYEFISQFVCYECGNPNACIVSLNGWYLPLCEKCWDNSNKRRQKGGYKVTSWEEVVDENYVGIPDEYVVIKGFGDNEQKIVHDIRETVNKIRKKMKFNEKTR